MESPKQRSLSSPDFVSQTGQDTASLSCLTNSPPYRRHYDPAWARTGTSSVPESARNSTCRRLPILHNHAQLAQVRVGNHEPDDVYPMPIRWTAESVRSSGMLPRQVRRRSRSVLPPGRWAQRPGVSSPNYRDYRALSSPAIIGHGLGCFHAGIAMKSTNVIESSWRCEGQSKRVALGPLGSRPSLLNQKG